MLNLLKQTKLSAEALAPYFGVSNMTIRRWPNKSNQIISKSERENIDQGVYKLIADGYLTSTAFDSGYVSKKQTPAYFSAVAKNLGLMSDTTKGKHKMLSVDSIADIGMDLNRQKRVETEKKSILKHLANGPEWKSRLMCLLNVLKSKKVSKLEKVVAYGALFYLITPFDFIPDHLPAIGLIDDFTVLGIAVAHYKSLLSRESKN